MTKAKKSATTRKKVKVVGTETYIKQDTGELAEMQVVSIEERDANFHKIWLEHIIHSMDIIGNQKIRFAFWLLDQMNAENQIIMTYRQMADKSGTSLDTVNRTMKALMESDFLRKVQLGVYQINPDIVFKGGKNNRMNVLLEYNNIQTKITDVEVEPEVLIAITDEDAELQEPEPEIPGQTSFFDKKEVV